MLLNQLRCEDGDPENLLRHSFFQFQADRALPDLEVCDCDVVRFNCDVASIFFPHFIDFSLQKQMRMLKEERDSIVVEEEDKLKDYYDTLENYKSLKDDVRSIVTNPKYCLRFLQPGRLVSILCENDETAPVLSLEEHTSWGVIVNFERVKSITSEGNYSIF